MKTKKTPKKKAAPKTAVTSLPQESPFRIVGIGASAGGLESFTELLGRLPINTGLAFVFIQHLDANHPSLSTEILKKATRIPVKEVRNQEKLEPNHIYVLPPNFEITLSHDILRLAPRSKSHPPKPIDTFFKSLAKERGTQAIGVVLSGRGDDGTEGLRAIKLSGGPTLAQTPKTAKYDSMPRSAIEAGAVEIILPPHGIADELVYISKQPQVSHPTLSKLGAKSQSKRGSAPEPLKEITDLIKQNINSDFSDYKKTTLIRRVSRRMTLHKLSSEEEYVKFLRSHPEELKTLFAEILIHVTDFFRDPHAFDSLREKVFPKIVSKHSQGSPIRIWVPGCSSGEEAYSLAMSLLNYLSDNPNPPPIQIFATDISDAAIQKARKGVYPEENVKNVPAPLLARFFTKTVGGYKVNKTIREVCLFSKHDVTSDPPFAKVDLVSCRNLLIYFSSSLQKRAIPLFHYALKPEGYLFLGQSETIGSFSNLFKPIDKNHKIYEKKQGLSVSSVLLSTARKRTEKTEGVSVAPVALLHQLDTQKEADRIIAMKYGPSSVVVNDDLEILQFRGRTFPFLEQPAGLATHRLLTLAHPHLAPQLRTLIQTAKAHSVSLRRDGIPFQIENVLEEVNLEVVPLNPAAEPKERQYLILFERQPSVLEETPPPHKSNATKSTRFVEDRILQLEHQLATSKEYQQTLTEDYEAIQEVLTSANEELQSANEELQSSNEELETAREELQSTNEELTTVNDELQNRNNELGVLNNDLVNLLGSIDIPIIMVNGDHRIRRFTPSATRLFHLIPSDVGRPIQDLRNKLHLSDVDSLIANVLETLAVKELEVQDENGYWYRLQIRPYRTTDHRIEGAVLSFVDIQALKLALGRIQKALDYSTLIADALKIPSIILDKNLTIRSVNQLFCKIFDLSASGAEGRQLTEISNPALDMEELKRRLEETLSDRTTFREFEISGFFSELGERTYLLNAIPIQWPGFSEPESVILSLLDITQRKGMEIERDLLLKKEQAARTEAERANKAKDVFLATLSHELRTPLTSILTWAQLIRMGKLDYEKSRAGAAVIEESAKNQNQLINDLLDISRIIANKLTPEITETDPSEILPLAIESIRPLADKKGVKIKAMIDEESGSILSDPLRLQQIVWNLLHNAVKFSPKDSEIIVKLEKIEGKQSSFVQIQVIDEGPGIDPSFLPHIFDRFSQADSTSTRAHGGLGLGLSIVRSLTELQGGTVQAMNSPKGKGAVFTVLFPVHKMEKGKAPEKPRFSAKISSPEEPPSLAGLRIIIVDDDQSTRDSVSAYLTSFGAEVKCCESVQECLNCLSGFKPDILVSDLAMPDEDGYSLIGKLRKLKESQGGALPALALTAYASEEESRKAMAAGFQAHLPKPVDSQKLAKTILKYAKTKASH
jgi:two-component system CheB/CheR fusion protein